MEGEGGALSRKIERQSDTHDEFSASFLQVYGSPLINFCGTPPMRGCASLPGYAGLVAARILILTNMCFRVEVSWELKKKKKKKKN